MVQIALVTVKVDHTGASAHVAVQVLLYWSFCTGVPVPVFP
jgi:hypothetical protein